MSLLLTKFLNLVRTYPLVSFGALVVLIAIIWAVTDCKRPKPPVERVVNSRPIESSPTEQERRDQAKWDSLNAIRP